MPYLDTVNKSAIQDLEKEIELLKIKCASYECIMEGLRQQVVRISHHLNILDPNYEGEKYEYTLQ